MAIIPTLRVRKLTASVEFYTKVLDFERLEADNELSDPGFVELRRGNDRLFLSSHRDDGAFGQAITLTTEHIDELFQRFRVNGLRTPGDPAAPVEVHEGPLDQSWGTREFYVADPDGHSLRFTQGL